MQIYVGHSMNFDFQTELYEPLRDSVIANSNIFVFPHQRKDQRINSKGKLRNVDCMIAEISYPSTGLGAELAWANQYGVPIIAVAKRELKISDSAQDLATSFDEYSNDEELIDKICLRLNNMQGVQPTAYQH